MEREKDDLLRSISGVGERLSLTLLAYVPELATLDGRQIAELVDVAPSAGTAELCEADALYGAAGLKVVPYVGALVDTRCNPAFRVF